MVTILQIQELSDIIKAREITIARFLDLEEKTVDPLSRGSMRSVREADEIILKSEVSKLFELKKEMTKLLGDKGNWLDYMTEELSDEEILERLRDSDPVEYARIMADMDPDTRVEDEDTGYDELLEQLDPDKVKELQIKVQNQETQWDLEIGQENRDK